MVWTGYPAREKGRERGQWGRGGVGSAVRRKTSMSSLQLLLASGLAAESPGTCQADVGLKARHEGGLGGFGLGRGDGVAQASQVVQLPSNFL